jgi:hypothetical protein
VDRAVEGLRQQTGWSTAQVRAAKRICYRTIFTETDWNIYSNVGVPESLTVEPNDGLPGHGGDKNSIGLYQSRAPWWWKVSDLPSITRAMDPYSSTIDFLTAMVRDTPDWWKRDESEVAQRTQRSQYDGVTIDEKTGKPYPYAQNYRDREIQTNAMDADLQYYTHGGR